jgi:hypothetical protein
MEATVGAVKIILHNEKNTAAGGCEWKNLEQNVFGTFMNVFFVLLVEIV